MKSILFSFIVIMFSVNTFAQIKSEELKTFHFTKGEYAQFRSYLISKKLKVNDTIFIKYDFNHEKCWDQLDTKNKEYINKIIQNFQLHISDFNKNFETAVAYNFREPGKSINKLKLWDNTIILDDQEVLKNLIFKNNVSCGSSAVILGDGSYLIYEKDPHFELLNLHHNYSGQKF